MTMRLQGTVALVTGASSGIGAATARSLAAQGAAVALLARRRDRLDALADAIRADGGTAIGVQADITSRQQASDAVERAVTELGRLDTVVNNAGLMHLGPVADALTEDWDQMLQINLQGLLYVTRAALPHLLRAAQDSPRGVADLVNISSTAGRVARPGTAVYNPGSEAHRAGPRRVRRRLRLRGEELLTQSQLAASLTSRGRPSAVPCSR
jgi:NADP-dependent 3-hydroxy acid dehydrogenase YdfG